MGSDLRIRYFCHAGQDTGYGVAAAEIALALVGAGAHLEIVPLNPSLSRFEGRSAALRAHVHDNSDIAYDVALVHTLPLDCAIAWHRHVGCHVEDEGKESADERERSAPLAITYTTWEGVDVPREVDRALELFDDVWVPSNATRDSFVESRSRAGLDGRVQDRRNEKTYVMPHAYEPRERFVAEVPAGRPFRFYYVGAWTTRKNPHGLLRAYAHAFTPADRVELVVHSPGVSMEMFAAAMVATGLEQRDLPRTTLSNEPLSDHALQQLHDTSDCFVTATRGEAWNLPAFDAMLAGRYVIAPSGMGHDDFLFDDPQALPFEGDLTDAARVASSHQPAFVDVTAVSTEGNRMAFTRVGAQGLTATTLWRDPNLVDLAWKMRDAFEQRRRDLRLFYKPDERFSHPVVAQQVITRIRHLLDRRSSR